MKKVVLIILLLGSFECIGGESHFARSPASLMDIANMCDEWDGWRTRCQEELNDPTFYADAPGENYLEECKTEPFWTFVWDKATAAMEDCFNHLDCSGGDDRCYGQMTELLNLNLDEDQLYLACMDKTQACSGLSSDGCTPIPVYHDEARGAVEQCLSYSCEDFSNCLVDPSAF
ncbi:MAG: hypothetical protein IPJ88_01555 [Myxococcales bacterium]|nr:MAG: hypothetical protein IPJ88_01555 [Myxococcales bacterium]